MEDKVRVLTATKDELQNHSTTQTNSLTDLQSRNANLVLENETLKRRIEDLSTVSDTECNI